MAERRRPGEVRDAIVTVLRRKAGGASVGEIVRDVSDLVGDAAPSSVRSYLRLNTPSVFVRTARGRYELREARAAYASAKAGAKDWKEFAFGKARMVNADCFDWLRARGEASIEAVVTDPPYGLYEYSEEQQEKLRAGKGGVWRIPPAFDGVRRSPLPRFTILRRNDLVAIEEFFSEWSKLLIPTLVPGANVVVASNPLLSYLVSGALSRAGLERRGEIVRLVMTMRGGDRPKAAQQEFDGVSVMPRSMWEPWLLYRKPLEGRVQDNLRRWKTGGFQRLGADKPFGDVIESAPTRPAERALAPHPSLKPQAFLRELVRGVLPLGVGIVLDPFAGAGSTLAAAEAVGYSAIGVERDPRYFSMAEKAIPKLAAYKNGVNYPLSL